MSLQLNSFTLTVPAGATGRTEIDAAWVMCGTPSYLELRVLPISTGITYSVFLPVNTTSFAVTPLLPGEGYEMWVEGRDETTNQLVVSNHAAASTNVSASAPEAPSIVASVSLSESAVRLTIQDNSTTESGFQIERYNPTNLNTVYWTIGAHTGTGTFTTDSTGAVAATMYRFRIRAYLDDTERLYSDWSAYFWASTSPPIAGRPPQPPYALAISFVSGTDDQAILTFSNPVGNNESGFHVRLYNEDNVHLYTTELGRGQTTTTLHDLIPNHSYTVYVDSWNGYGTNVDLTGEEVYIDFVMPPSGVELPLPPTLRDPLGYAAGYVDVRWVRNSVTYAETLELWRDTVPATNNTRIAQDLLQQDGHYLDTGLTPGNEYEYTMKSVNRRGTSAASDPEDIVVPVTVETDAEYFFSCEAVAIDDTQVLISWALSYINAIDVVIRMTVPSASTLATITDPNVVAWVASGLTAETAYTFELDVEDGNGVYDTISCSATTKSADLPTAVVAPTMARLIMVNSTTLRASATVNDSRASVLKFYKSTDGENYSLATTVNAPSNEGDLTSLTPNTVYYVYAKSEAQGIASAASNVLNQRTGLLDQGRGRVAVRRGIETRVRQIDKDQADLVIQTIPPNRTLLIRTFRYVAPDETDGPFVTLQVDGEDKAIPSTYDGQTLLRNAEFDGGADGKDVSIAVSGTGTGLGNLVMVSEFI